MESKLSKVLLSDKNYSTSRVRLKATVNFPIDTPKTYRITGGYPSRMYFVNGAIECASDDAVTGFPKLSGNPRACAECNHREDSSCSYRCTLELEHENPEKVYIISVPYSAQLNLSEYVRTLLADGLDAPDVLTKITRTEGDNGYPTYIFELDSIAQDECDIELTVEEESAAADLLKTAQLRGPDGMSIEEFVDLLSIMIDIPESRAGIIAAMFVSDGVIK